jgi:hypothetical protein
VILQGGAAENTKVKNGGRRFRLICIQLQSTVQKLQIAKEPRLPFLTFVFSTAQQCPCRIAVFNSN